MRSIWGAAPWLTVTLDQRDPPGQNTTHMVSKKPRGRGRPRSTSQTPLSKWIDGSGRTREQVAEALGVTKASLDRYCRGERTPTLGAALAIEKVTGGAIPARSWLPRSSR